MSTTRTLLWLALAVLDLPSAETIHPTAAERAALVPDWAAFSTAALTIGRSPEDKARAFRWCHAANTNERTAEDRKAFDNSPLLSARLLAVNFDDEDKLHVDLSDVPGILIEMFHASHSYGSESNGRRVQSDKAAVDFWARKLCGLLKSSDTKIIQSHSEDFNYEDQVKYKAPFLQRWMCQRINDATKNQKFPPQQRRYLMRIYAQLASIQTSFEKLPLPIESIVDLNLIPIEHPLASYANTPLTPAEENANASVLIAEPKKLEEPGVKEDPWGDFLRRERLKDQAKQSSWWLALGAAAIIISLFGLFHIWRRRTK
jgi:hypothetical protein